MPISAYIRLGGLGLGLLDVFRLLVCIEKALLLCDMFSLSIDCTSSTLDLTQHGLPYILHLLHDLFPACRQGSFDWQQQADFQSDLQLLVITLVLSISHMPTAAACCFVAC